MDCSPAREKSGKMIQGFAGGARLHFKACGTRAICTGGGVDVLCAKCSGGFGDVLDKPDPRCATRQGVPHIRRQVQGETLYEMVSRSEVLGPMGAIEPLQR